MFDVRKLKVWTPTLEILKESLAMVDECTLHLPGKLRHSLSENVTAVPRFILLASAQNSPREASRYFQDALTNLEEVGENIDNIERIEEVMANQCQVLRKKIRMCRNMLQAFVIAIKPETHEESWEKLLRKIDFKNSYQLELELDF